MNVMDTLYEDAISADSALQIFDDLSPIDTSFMLGRWKGCEVMTGHPMDGLLAFSGWYGKYFIDEDNVHPLLFYKNKTELYSINPKRIAFNLIPVAPKTPKLARVLRLAKPLLQTNEGKARLRMMNCRGQASATMCYDERPIHDCFRKLDENRVLGLMDMKGSARPYFFILERDASPMKIAIPQVKDGRQ